MLGMKRGVTIAIFVVVALSVVSVGLFFSQNLLSSGSSFQSDGTAVIQNSTLFTNGTFQFVLGNPASSQVNIVAFTMRPAWNNSAAQNCPTCSSPQISETGNNTSPAPNQIETTTTTTGADNASSPAISISTSDLVPISGRSFQSEKCILVPGAIHAGGEYVFVINLSSGQTLSGNIIAIA
jgi:hypothetical protein